LVRRFRPFGLEVRMLRAIAPCPSMFRLLLGLHYAALVAVLRLSGRNVTQSSIAPASHPPSPADLDHIMKTAVLLKPKLGAQSNVQSGGSNGSSRLRLDVGLNAFEAKAEDALLASLAARLPLSLAAPARERFNKTFRGEFRARFLDGVKPAKVRVAKHWTELKPEKRDMFFQAVKERFGEILGQQLPRFEERSKLAFFTERDLPPKADDALVRSNVDKLISKVVPRLEKQLEDYVEMYYMSNIFLQFRIAVPRRRLEADLGDLLVV